MVLDLTPMAAQPIKDAIGAVRWGGTIVLAGLKGHKEIPIQTDMLINKALTVKGAFSVDAAAYQAARGRGGRRGRHPRRGHAGPVSLGFSGRDT